MQISKILKKSIDMFFNNLYLILIQQYLSYENVKKIKSLLIKPLYVKIT